MARYEPRWWPHRPYREKGDEGSCAVTRWRRVPVTSASRSGRATYLVIAPRVTRLTPGRTTSAMHHVVHMSHHRQDAHFSGQRRVLDCSHEVLTNVSVHRRNTLLQSWEAKPDQRMVRRRGSGRGWTEHPGVCAFTWDQSELCCCRCPLWVPRLWTSWWRRNETRHHHHRPLPSAVCRLRTFLRMKIKMFRSVKINLNRLR